MKLTRPLERVLRVFLEDPSAQRYGYALMRAAGLPSGTLYPMLARLQEQGLVSSAWETPEVEGQRPRRYYRLTAEGIRTARLELARLSMDRRPDVDGSPRPAPGRAG